VIPPCNNHGLTWIFCRFYHNWKLDKCVTYIDNIIPGLLRWPVAYVPAFIRMSQHNGIDSIKAYIYLLIGSQQNTIVSSLMCWRT